MLPGCETIRCMYLVWGARVGREITSGRFAIVLDVFMYLRGLDHPPEFCGAVVTR